MSNQTIKERELFVNITANGKIFDLDPELKLKYRYGYEKKEFSFDYQSLFHKINDNICLQIYPNTGYIIGLIDIKEQTSGNKIVIHIDDSIPGENFEIINFKMPNDNVNVYVKFVKQLSV